MLDVVIDVGELTRALLMCLQDLSKVKEATFPGHLGRCQHVDVPQDESLSGTWTVQESTGELLQAVTRGEVKKSWELRLLLCHRLASLASGGREGEKWEAVLRDVRHQVRCQGLVKLIFAVWRYVEGLAKELEGVTEAGQ